MGPIRPTHGLASHLATYPWVAGINRDPQVHFCAPPCVHTFVPSCRRAFVPFARFGPVALSVIVCLCVVTQTHAQTLARQRLVHLFDFEETINGRKLGDLEKLPLHWYAMGRNTGIGNARFTRLPLHRELIEAVGYPAWTRVQYDGSHRVSGDYSFHLGLNGGSAGAFLRVGVLPAVPSSDYLITAAVRTTPMAHARPRLLAYFADREGRRIDASVSASPALSTDDRWQSVSVPLAGSHNDAAWIVLQIELNQSVGHGPASLGDRRIVYEQVQGGAWFDDIAVWQMPRLTIATQSPANVIRAPDRPRLSIEVVELSGRPLTAQVAVRDYRGELAAINMMQMGGAMPPRRHWSPPLPGFGWYSVELSVQDEPEADARQGVDSLVARATAALLWLPPASTGDPSQMRRFAVTAEGIEPEQIELLPALLEQAGIASVVVSAWDAAASVQEIDARQVTLDAQFDRFLAGGGQLELSLNPVPAVAAHRLGIDEHDPIRLLMAPRREWLAYLRPVVMRHGQRVRRWQLGSAAVPSADGVPDLGPSTTRVWQEFRAMVPAPRLVLPWDLTRHRPKGVDTNVQWRLVVPEAVQPDWIVRGVDDWMKGEQAVWLHLPSPPAEQVGHVRRCEDLALRLVHAWASGAAGVSVARPWTAGSHSAPGLHPDPLLGVFANAAQRLSGRSFLGELPLGHGLACMVFDETERSDGGLLVAWNRFALPTASVIDLYLGERPVLVDIFGNRRELGSDAQRHRVVLTKTPVFIEGIDPRLAMFRASFGVEPSFVESTQSMHEHTVTLANPWERTISGRLRFTGPEGWSIEPRSTGFSIASGQATTLPIRIMFPVSEPAGPKQLTAQMSFMAERQYDVDMATPMRVGLRDVDFDATLVREVNPVTGEFQTVVTQLIRNSSTKTLALYAFAHVPGAPRQERIVPELKPGQVVVRRFRFDVGDAADQALPRVRVGLRQTSGPTMLTKLIAAHEPIGP